MPIVKGWFRVGASVLAGALYVCTSGRAQQAREPSADALAIAPVAAADRCTPAPGEGWPVAPGAGTGTRSVVETVRWLGRVDDRAMNAPAFSWSLSGFELRFCGTELNVSLATAMDHGYLVVLDGRPIKRFQTRWGVGVYSLASGLADREHTIALLRETEGQYGPTTLLGFSGARILAPPPPRARSIEVVGDSVAAGYGVLASVRHLPPNDGPGCGYSFLTQSAYESFVAIAARELEADLSVIAVSGWGAYRGRDHGTDKNLPSLYDRVLADHELPRWNFRSAPQAVVVNLGANDIAPPAPSSPGEGNFSRAYRKLLKTIRRHYPEAWIVCALSTTLSDEYPADVQARTLMRAWTTRLVDERVAAGDRRISFIEFPRHDRSITGCDWHPSRATHERMAAQLAQELRRRLGW